MLHEELLERMQELNPEALYPTGMAEAIIGIGERCGQPALFVVSAEKCLELLMRDSGMSREDAEEFYEFNVVLAWRAHPHLPELLKVSTKIPGSAFYQDMTKALDPGKTYTVGYFNANKWPIHLAISELNTTLQLQPNEYVLNRQGHKINDPLLEKYCGPMRLSREDAADDKPVDLVAIPKGLTERRKYDGHAVREVTQFTRERGGVPKPVIPPPMLNPRPTEDTNPVKMMTMEQARKSGFLRKTREVPEDYGVTDTTGAPPPGEKIPQIKYAVDSTQGAHQQGKVDLSQARVLSESELEKLAQTTGFKLPAHPQVAPDAEDAETDDGFANQEVELPAPNIPGAAKLPPVARPSQPFPVSGGNVLDLPEAEDVADEDVADEAVPEPPENVELKESVLPRRRTVAAELDADEDAPEPARPVSARRVRRGYECSECDVAPFRFRHQLERHAREEHTRLVEKIMAPYPEE